MAATDQYYEELFKSTLSKEGLPVGAGAATTGKNILSKLKGVKGIGAQLLGFMVLNRLLQSRNQSLDRGVQSEAIQSQRELATPENLYYQAALPQAQQEEEMARSALFQQISGGVLGPSLAKGERRIGG